LCDLSAKVGAPLGAALEDAGYEVIATTVLDERARRADVVVVEAGHGPEVLRDARGLRRTVGGPAVIGVVGWWSEDEVDVQRAADTVLHVPWRNEQLRALVESLPRAARPSDIDG
jgi:hypothetical protein